MLYAVRVELSAEEWERAVEKCRQVLAPHQNHVEDLPAAKLHEVHLTVMRQALQPHHEWLAKQGITTVISPDRLTNGSIFVFYFDNEREATLFKRQFVDLPARDHKKDEREPE
jgi:hypothetical protein